ncbi:MAG: triose-phosphate isomerase [Atopobium sp.]|jgi:triose-phosphate isomerase|nr:triose-phosphate isomerase [Atopobium sp.]MDU2590375.1 triose-phosphate isomerase [Atopobium sp.]
MRNRMIAGNWKMNETFAEGIELAQGIVDQLASGTGNVDVVIAPPLVDLKGVSEVLSQANSSVALSAQNVYWEESGAFTGETSPAMLTSVGATHCIIGHSERRGYFGETDEDINRKAKALMAHGIVPISCCGESLEVRNAGTHVQFVVDQIKADTKGLEITDPSKYVIAYEPIWAIGTGMTATADDAQEVCGAIRKTLVEIFGAEIADGIRILYGGSAKPENVGGFLEKEDVDGALVGGASLKADSFVAMVKSAMN